MTQSPNGPIPMKTVYAPTHLLHAPAKEFLDGELVDVFEKPSRAELILDAVKRANLGEILPPRDFGMGPIEAIHAPDYLEFLQTAFARWIADGRSSNGVFPDTFFKPPFQHRPTKIGALAGIYVMDMSAPIVGGTWQAAYHSAQCALTAAALVRAGERSAFALCRPPGHHAHANIAGGYCYLNNVAIAANFLLGREGREGLEGWKGSESSEGSESSNRFEPSEPSEPAKLSEPSTPLRRVAILDIDVHHGNGTQHIFYERNDVLFVSLHGHPDWEYPYFLGGKAERGVGAGLGYNLNYPLPQGCDDALYLSTLDQACMQIAQYAPDSLLISLGADTFALDPIGGLALTSAAYAQIGQRLAQLNLPTVFIMEGGYAIAQLGENVANVLKGFEN